MLVLYCYILNSKGKPHKLGNTNQPRHRSVFNIPEKTVRTDFTLLRAQVRDLRYKYSYSCQNPHNSKTKPLSREFSPMARFHVIGPPIQCPARTVEDLCSWSTSTQRIFLTKVTSFEMGVSIFLLLCA